MRRTIVCLVGIVALLGCRGGAERKPDPAPSAKASTPPAPTELPKIQLVVGDEQGVTSGGDKCLAKVKLGEVEISCSSPEESTLEVTAKGQTAKSEKSRQDHSASVRVSLAGAVLERLGDLDVPPLERVHRVKGPVDLDYDTAATIKLDPGITFKLSHRSTVASGSVAPFEMPLHEALSFTLPEIRKLAGKTLLFPGEKADDPAPAAHSMLFFWGRLGYVALNDTAYLAKVLGPAKTVRDTDWLVVKDSTFSDSGKHRPHRSSRSHWSRRREGLCARGDASLQSLRWRIRRGLHHARCDVHDG